MTTPGKNPDPLSRLITEGQPKTPLPPLSDDGGGATSSGGLPDRNQDLVRARNATACAAALDGETLLVECVDDTVLHVAHDL